MAPTSTTDSTQAAPAQPTTGRGCGECVACCHAAAIEFPTFTKPARARCLHVLDARPGCAGRCGIYGGARPVDCSQFRCSWLDGDVTAEPGVTVFFKPSTSPTRKAPHARRRILF